MGLKVGHSGTRERDTAGQRERNTYGQGVCHSRARGYLVNVFSVYLLY